MVFYLCIAHPIKPLQEQYLKHENGINRLAARVALLIRVLEHGFQNVAEPLKVYDFLQLGQRISVFEQLLKGILLVKQSNVLILTVFHTYLVFLLILQKYKEILI